MLRRSYLLPLLLAACFPPPIDRHLKQEDASHRAVANHAQATQEKAILPVDGQNPAPPMNAWIRIPCTYHGFHLVRTDFATTHGMTCLSALSFGTGGVSREPQSVLFARARPPHVAHANGCDEITDVGVELST